MSDIICRSSIFNVSSYKVAHFLLIFTQESFGGLLFAFQIVTRALDSNRHQKMHAFKGYSCRDLVQLVLRVQCFNVTCYLDQRTPTQRLWQVDQRQKKEQLSIKVTCHIIYQSTIRTSLHAGQRSVMCIRLCIDFDDSHTFRNIEA